MELAKIEFRTENINMNKLLVFSDSHGDVSTMKKVIAKNPDIKEIVHLGDFANDLLLIEEIREKNVHLVMGNCDIDKDNPKIQIIKIYNKTILCVHRYNQKDQDNSESLLALATEYKADIMLYGHTHVCSIVKKDDIVLINPGSIGNLKEYKYVKSYALLEFSDYTVKATICSEF